MSFGKIKMEDWKLELRNKPEPYVAKLYLKKIMERMPEDDLEKLDFPCNLCLVNASCTIHCVRVFRYMNYIADHMGIMTADEIHVYRHVVPNNVRQKIKGMLGSNSRLAHPQL